MLAQWTPVALASLEIAPRLGQWVGAFDAIGLQAAHRAIQELGTAPAGTARANRAAAGLAQDFERARATLARAIAQDPALPNETTYTPYKRRHLELQRQMEQLIVALRAHVREVLAKGPAAWRQLAALDEAMDKVIAPREQALLAGATVLLQGRFEALRREHKDEDDSAGWRRPGGWLHAFEQDWHQAVLAELALRLQPVAGLIEATGIELNETP